jgi:hypothetical protein
VEYQDNNLENPKWLAGASMNIVDSCFSKVPGSAVAIRYATEGSPSKLHLVTYNVCGSSDVDVHSF